MPNGALAMLLSRSAAATSRTSQNCQCATKSRGRNTTPTRSRAALTTGASSMAMNPESSTWLPPYQHSMTDSTLLQRVPSTAAGLWQRQPLQRRSVEQSGDHGHAENHRAQELPVAQQQLIRLFPLCFNVEEEEVTKHAEHDDRYREHELVAGADAFAG